MRLAALPVAALAQDRPVVIKADTQDRLSISIRWTSGSRQALPAM
jgi:hypothetical protein